MDDDYDELQDIPFVDAAFKDTDLAELVQEDKPLEVQGKAVIPFNSIYQPPVKFKTLQRKIFIPDVPVTVRFIKYERNVTSNLINPNLYTIQVEHGDYTWTICKRYKHIQHLHHELKLFRTSLNIPFPTRTHREHRNSFKQEKNEKKTNEVERRKSMPRFPNKPEVLVGYDQVEDRMQQLEKYLNNVLSIKVYRMHHETLTFLSVSHLSFVQHLGIKGLEGLVKKRTGSTRNGCHFCGLIHFALCTRCTQLCSDIFGQWRERWLFVKDTFLGYVRPKDGRVQGIMLFDHAFEVSTGYSTGRNRLQIVNSQRRIIFKCWTKRKRQEWCNMLRDVANKQGFGFTQTNQYSSYAPVRRNTSAAWFVDGSSFMAAVAELLDSAREEIYITDWWLSPEIHLKRPVAKEGDHYRLDMLLRKKATEGVKIFVMLYKEVELALGINSYYSKQQLNNLHPNIKVLRHPDHANSGVFLWAHHEKIICIDQTHAFVGGIDLCYGRWDDHAHRLIDLGSSSLDMPFTSKNRNLNSSKPTGSKIGSVQALLQASSQVTIGALSASQPNLAPGDEHKTDEQEEENEVVQAVPDVETVVDGCTTANNGIGASSTSLVMIQPTAENIKCNTPEMARKTMYIKLKESVRTTSRHLIQKMKPDGDTLSDSLEDSDIEEEKRESELHEQIVAPQVASTVSDCPPLPDLGIDNYTCVPETSENKYWIGKDYANFIVKDLVQLDMPYQDLVNRNVTPRMPWHDIGVYVHGAVARDVARHFIQRWNGCKLEKAKRFHQYPWLMPKSYEYFDEPFRIRNKTQYKVTCQVLRSASAWSAGFMDQEEWEESIHEAYVTVISKAEHFIYIENQFFISLARQNQYVKNQVGEALCKRIFRAHKEGKKFRVIVIMPLLPGFEGEVGAPSGAAIHTVTHWNYASISRGKDSIIARLIDMGVENPSDYITFHGLRKYSTLHGDLVTELIYVHSKLMIVDDKIVICGSANINDRSLLGKRDSEVAVIIEDEDLYESRMNKQPYLVGKYAASLRKFIFGEHLGLLSYSSDPNKQPESPGTYGDIDLTDPVCDTFYRDTWINISQNNTQIFEEVFRCLPSDEVTCFKDLKTYQEQNTLAQKQVAIAIAKLNGIQGHLVNLPLNFLLNENLTPNPNSMEGIMPTSLWT